jgi:hypothetical protein
LKRVLIVSVLAAALIAPSALSTTKPGVLYIVPVTITDKTVAIQKDRFTRHGVTRYPRGALIRFSVRNKGTKTYALRIWGEDTDPIPPGGKGSILVNWTTRGKYTYMRVYRHKAIPPVRLVVIF